MNRIAVIAVVALAGWTACGDDKTGDTPGASINPPTGLTVVPLEGGAHLTWMDNSDNEAEFMIERKTGSGDWTTIGSVPFNITLYHDPGLTPGTTYSYRVMAMPQEGESHASGEGAYSDEVTLTTPADGAAGDTGSSGSGGTGGAGAGGEHTGAAGGHG